MDDINYVSDLVPHNCTTVGQVNSLSLGHSDCHEAVGYGSHMGRKKNWIWTTFACSGFVVYIRICATYVIPLKCHKSVCSQLTHSMVFGCNKSHVLSFIWL